MKKHFKLLSLLFMGLAIAFITACNDDDDEKSENGNNTAENVNGEDVKLPEPKYLNDAAIYHVTSADSEYESIELTESGYAVITMNSTGKSRMVTRSFMGGLLPKGSFAQMKTRADDDDDSWTPQCYWLRYEKTGDGTYRLWHIVGSQAGKDWGTLKVAKDTPDDPVKARLEITRANGYPQVIEARWDDLWKDDLASQSLCRSWEIEKITVDFVKSYTKGTNKNTVKKEFSNFKQYYQWIIDEMMNGKKPSELGIEKTPTVEEVFEVPLQIIFTRSGTYIVFYDDGTATINNWVWAEQQPPYKTIHYSHNLNDLYDQYASGEVTHSYEYDAKRQLYILKIFEDQGEITSLDDEVKMEGEAVYYMRPVTEQ